MSNKRLCYAQEHPVTPVWGYLVIFATFLALMTHQVFNDLPMGWGLYVMGTIMIAIDLVIGTWMVVFIWHNFRSRTKLEMAQYRWIRSDDPLFGLDDETMLDIYWYGNKPASSKEDD